MKLINYIFIFIILSFTQSLADNQTSFLVLEKKF